MRTVLRSIATTLAVGAALVTAAGTATAAPSGLSDARAATAGFHRVSAAVAAGWSLELHDLAGIACIDNPAGGMGVHYVNGGLVGDGVVSATAPEALVYEPDADGSLRLVAVEYVVLRADWDAAHTAVPQLFGQDFELVLAGNRYGLPDFYELHAWLWKANPSGTFEDWNPRVTCP